MEPSSDVTAPTEAARPPPTNKRFQQTQAQVNEVVDIMRVNMEKVLERDAKLAQLDDRADALQAGASQFEASAGKLKNKYWWKNMKMTLALGIVGLILVIALGCEFNFCLNNPIFRYINSCFAQIAFDAINSVIDFYNVG
uniref:V-SNARE coiled-coil homology domain-containing protein n=1 Tax=Mesocestoides corti TaxID=53468 RepID=A0A5K3EVC7_MESCO